MNAINIERLTKAFDGKPVFVDLDLVVAQGETVAVLGPSGCGKSTLLRCIAGLERPTGGTARAEGDVGYVFQEPRLLPWLNVEKNVRFAARDDVERARVGGVLGLTGLHDAARLLPKQLSGGMAQRTALARTLVRNPSILLLDEPLAALDALRRMDLQAALASIIATLYATALLVTHDVDEALYLADRIVVLGGSPSRIETELVVPLNARRRRDADLTPERTTLLRALGVEDHLPSFSI
ncbi:MAG TPA: ABC transporter ATP-binding protein [Candidatus Binatia bacterium]|nr:ABC transporter ATP-binding protein [Candidatus Binatia bacterium]